MIIKLKFVEVAIPLFLGGRNHGLKLSQEKTGIKLVEDTEERKIYATYNGEVGYIPVESAGTVVPEDSSEWALKYFADKGVKEKPVAKAPRALSKAQVTNPHDHVFSNGAGKTHD